LNARVLLEKIKQAYRQFASDQPGQRFVHLYERRGRKGKQLWLCVVAVSSGILLILMGSFLSLVPGVPGIVLGALGLALIATRFRRVAIWVDWGEVKARQWLRKWRRARATR
jgi:hypothetical protein